MWAPGRGQSQPSTVKSPRPIKGPGLAGRARARRRAHTLGTVTTPVPSNAADAAFLGGGLSLVSTTDASVVTDPPVYVPV